MGKHRTPRPPRAHCGRTVEEQRAFDSKRRREWRQANATIYKAQNKASHARNRDVRIYNSRAFKLRAYYGLTPEGYEAMVVAQGGVCGICKQPENNRRLAIDHDHITGIVRGLLCGRCNTGIGWFREDPDTMIAALEYLKRHKKQAAA